MASTADAGALNGLLLQLAAGGGAGLSGALPGTDEMVAQLAGDDPLRSLLVRQVLERHDRDGDDEDGEDEEDDEDRAPRESEARAKARERALLRRLRETRDEVMALRERNDALAAALGACYLCWGEDVRCPVCGGHGSPGTMAPDRGEFALYVAPALKHLQPRGDTRRGVEAGGRSPALRQHPTQPERRFA